MLVQKYREAHGDGEDKEIRAEISRAVDASPSLRNKKDLIEDFVDSVSASGEIDEEWRDIRRCARRPRSSIGSSMTRASSQRRRASSSRLPSATAPSRRLAPRSPRCFRPSRASQPDGGHGEKKQRVLTKLGAFFERFFGLSSTSGGRSDD